MCLYSYTNHLRWNKAPGIGIWVGPNNNSDFLNSKLAPASVIEKWNTDSTFHWRQKLFFGFLQSRSGSFCTALKVDLGHLFHHHSCPKNIYWENNDTSACKLKGSWGFALVLQIWDQCVQHIRHWSVLVQVAISASQWHLLGRRRKI